MTEVLGTIRAVHFDDQPYYVEFIANGLTQSGIDVVGTASTPAEMQQLVRSTVFDVVILDVLVGPDRELTGLSIGLWLRLHLPQIGVLMFTSYDSPFPAFRLMQIEPAVRIGYLLKTSVQYTSEIVAAVTELGRGHNVLDNRIQEELLSLESGTHPGKRLSDEELKILGLIVEGLTNEQIAAQCHFSLKAIEAKISAIFRKLGLSDSDAQQRPNLRVKAVMLWVDSLQKFRDAKHVEPVDWPAPYQNGHSRNT